LRWRIIVKSLWQTCKLFLGCKIWNHQTICNVQRTSVSWLQTSVTYRKWSLLNIFKDSVVVYSPSKPKAFWSLYGSVMYIPPFSVPTIVIPIL
jgi:hypothetical protein